MLIDQNKKSLTEQDLNDLRKFVTEFRRLLVETKTDKQLIRMINENLQAFGPHSTGSNLLINKFIPKQDSLLHKIDTILGVGEEEKKETAHSVKKAAEIKQRIETMQTILQKFQTQNIEMMNSLITGFNNATSAGPMCEEPMQGACFIIQNLELCKSEEEEKESQNQQEIKEETKGDTYGPFAG